MSVNFKRVKGWLNDFDFKGLFVEELGWNPPPRSGAALFGGVTPRPVAELGGVVVFEVVSEAALTDAKLRREVHKELEKGHLELLLIFVDAARTRSLWSWLKRENGRAYARDHLYVKGQPGNLFLGKLSGIVFDLTDFDESGNVSVVQVASRLKNALDVERTTKKFYREFQAQHLEF